VLYLLKIVVEPLASNAIRERNLAQFVEHALKRKFMAQLDNLPQIRD
jgi:hypothetical protein